MRNLLKRRPSADPKPTLRERFAATKEKYSRTLAAHRALNGPLPGSKPAADRTALLCYATWLGLERSRVSRDLYPHLGTRAVAFAVGMNAGEDWHFNKPGASGGLADRGPVLERAVKVLDLFGVDWRGDKAKARDPDHVAPDITKDTGERPELPHGWPQFDAALLEALDDLNRLDAAQDAMGKVGPDDRDVDTVPGYSDLEGARYEALERLARVRAEGLAGLQSKAKALLTSGVSSVIGEHYQDLTESLARDLLGASNRTIEPQPDPIFAVIEESRRLDALHDGFLDALASAPEDHPEKANQHAAHGASWRYWREAVLTTVPQTAGGCRALASYAGAWFKMQGANDEDAETVLALIARSPLL